MTARILPRESGASLDIVIGIMAFLAAVALAASLLAERAATGWREGLADRLTVQIVPDAEGDARPLLDHEALAALDVVRATPGIAHASVLSDAESAALVEPWLGKNAIIPELPLPRLIDAAIEPGEAINIAALTHRLRRAAPHAIVDDHGHWINRLRVLSQTLILSAYGIVVLMAGAMAATVVFATRAGLNANHEKVELLHRMGARGRFIAAAFERHFLLSAFLASAGGAAIAAALFGIVGSLEYANVDTIRLLPPLALKTNEYGWLALIPAGSAAIAFLATRFSVLAALRNIY